MTEQNTALEAFEWLIRNNPVPEQDQDTHEAVETIRAALQSQAEPAGSEEWLPEEEWHEDYNDCVFVFMNRRGDFHHAIFSSPISSDYPSEKLNLLGFFKRVNTNDLWDISKKVREKYEAENVETIRGK